MICHHSLLFAIFLSDNKLLSDRLTESKNAYRIDITILLDNKESL